VVGVNCSAYQGTLATLDQSVERKERGAAHFTDSLWSSLQCAEACWVLGKIARQIWQILGAEPFMAAMESSTKPDSLMVSWRPLFGFLLVLMSNYFGT